MPWDTPKPVLARLLTTVMLASVIVTGGLLHSAQWIRTAEPQLGQAAPASLEMMQLLRDEHDLVADMVKAQLASNNGFDAQPAAAAERLRTIALR
jgi:hypothetical protein